MSSSVHIGNKKKILILGEGSRLDDTTLTLFSIWGKNYLPLKIFSEISKNMGRPNACPSF